MLIVLVVLWACLQTGLTQLLELGDCPKLAVEQNFDLKKYTGCWYSIFAFNTEAFQGNGNCVLAHYSSSPESGKVIVYNEQISSNGKLNSINGTAIPEDKNKKEGKLKVTLNIDVLKYKIPVTSNYWVLVTDYYNYAVVCSCFTIKLTHTLACFILSRHVTLSEEFKKKIDVYLKAAGIPWSRFKQVDQTNCGSHKCN
uniref:Lipocalin/cytosolic fatty-acid binding domain-containing protein n=1 Tax=Graphocephala atropunctata TaxID=36148 RepID=A0A1B6MT52_9HEMI